MRHNRLIVLLMVCTTAWAAAAVPSPPPRSGGVVIGFDPDGRPIPPSHPLPPTPADSASAEAEVSFTFSCAESVRPAYRAYILNLLSQVQPHIERFYGPPPAPVMHVEVVDDGSGSGWFYYDTARRRIIISTYPDLPEWPDPGQTDPAFDALLVHELIHAYHDGLWVFASWVEEGMTQCALELLAEYLAHHGIRDIRDPNRGAAPGRHPQANLLLFDTLDQLGPDVVGGTLYAAHKASPDLFYRSAAALFFLLCASQADDPPPPDLSTYRFLARLNAALREIPNGVVTESAFWDALDQTATRPVDGRPAAQWARTRSVTATQSRPGTFLAVWPAYDRDEAGHVRFTVANPHFCKVMAIRRQVDAENPWRTREDILTADVPIRLSIHNAAGDLVWSTTRPNAPVVALTNPNGDNWIEFGPTDTWPTGWYRLAAEVDLPGHGPLFADNVFLLCPTGERVYVDGLLDEASDGMGLIALGASGRESALDRLLLGPQTASPWLGQWAMLARPAGETVSSNTLTVLLEKRPYTFTLPLPYTRVVPFRDYTYIVPDARFPGTHYTGISIVNPEADRPADIQVWMHTPDGSAWGIVVPDPDTDQPAAPADARPAELTLPPAGQYLNLASGLFPTPADERGWLRLEADRQLATFSLSGDTAGAALDGTLSLGSAARRWLFPMLQTEWGYETILSLVNPQARPATGRALLYAPDGSLLGYSSLLPLPPRGQRVVGLPDLFPGLLLDDDQYVLLMSDHPLAAACAFSNGHSLASLPAFPAPITFDLTAAGLGLQPGPATLFSPHAMVGGGYQTVIQLVNPDLADETTVTFRFLDGAGVALTDEPLRLTLPAGAKVVLDLADILATDPAGPGQDGWLRLECDPVPVQGAVAFGAADGTFLSAQPLARTTARRLAFGHVAHGLAGDVNYFTGLALLNPNTATAHFRLTLRDASGHVTHTTVEPLELAPGERLSRLIQDFFPELEWAQGGWVEVESDLGLVGFELFGDLSMEFLSAVPATPLR